MQLLLCQRFAGGLGAGRQEAPSCRGKPCPRFPAGQCAAALPRLGCPSEGDLLWRAVGNDPAASVHMVHKRPGLLWLGAANYQREAALPVFSSTST